MFNTEHLLFDHLWWFLITVSLRPIYLCSEGDFNTCDYSFIPVINLTLFVLLSCCRVWSGRRERHGFPVSLLRNQSSFQTELSHRKLDVDSSPACDSAAASLFQSSTVISFAWSINMEHNTLKSKLWCYSWPVYEAVTSDTEVGTRSNRWLTR